MGKKISYGVECWKCNHFWWQPFPGDDWNPGDDWPTAPCPECGEENAL